MESYYSMPLVASTSGLVDATLVDSLDTCAELAQLLDVCTDFGADGRKQITVYDSVNGHPISVSPITLFFDQLWRQATGTQAPQPAPRDSLARVMDSRWWSQAAAQVAALLEAPPAASDAPPPAHCSPSAALDSSCSLGAVDWDRLAREAEALDLATTTITAPSTASSSASSSPATTSRPQLPAPLECFPSAGSDAVDWDRLCLEAEALRTSTFVAAPVAPAPAPPSPSQPSSPCCLPPASPATPPVRKAACRIPRGPSAPSSAASSAACTPASTAPPSAASSACCTPYFSRSLASSFASSRGSEAPACASLAALTPSPAAPLSCFEAPSALAWLQGLEI